MLVFWEARLVFLATPRTGSTAIAAALEPLAAMSVQRPRALKHTPAYRYHSGLRGFLEETAGAPFTAVAVMREPVDWLRSWYRFLRSEPAAEGAAVPDFADFVEGYLSETRPAFADIEPQSRFLARAEGRAGGTTGRAAGGLGVDRLFRYEDMPSLLAFLEDRLDCALTLPVLNVSPPGDTRLPAVLEGRLREGMAADIALHARISPGGFADGPQ